jgi:4-hydroxy-tetrahydrodipicolinate synthase
LGLCTPEARLPMVPISEASKKAVKDAMVHAGLLN